MGTLGIDLICWIFVPTPTLTSLRIVVAPPHNHNFVPQQPPMSTHTQSQVQIGSQLNTQPPQLR